MKLFKIITAATLAIVITIAGSNLNTFDVSAGSSDVVVDKSTFAEALDDAKWNNANGDVTAEGGKLIFPADSTEDTKLIVKSPAKASGFNNELFSADATMKLKKLPSGETFVFGAAFANIESYMGDPGNVEVRFENNNGIKASVVAIDQDGEKTVLSKPQSCGSLGGTIKVSIRATVDKKLTVKVNGKTLFNGASPVELEGRIGFIQTGNCEVEVSDVDIVSHQYDTPENTNVEEDFEDGGINVKALSSKLLSGCGYFPAGVHIEDYNGNKVLMFKNAAAGYFGTIYQYSNFELTFDVPYMLHSNVLREDGTVLQPVNANFVVAIGDESSEYTGFGYSTAAASIVFSSTNVYNMKDDKMMTTFKENEYCDLSGEEGYSVKIVVKDTQITAYIKKLDGTKYTEVLSYKSGNQTPLGYVHIWSAGQSNFAIDNFKITNLDEGAKVVEVGDEKGIVEGTEDWEYQPMEVVYMEQETGNANLPWIIAMVGAAALGAIFVAVCFIITKVKNRPKKEKAEVVAEVETEAIAEETVEEEKEVVADES